MDIELEKINEKIEERKKIYMIKAISILDKENQCYLKELFIDFYF